MITTVYKFTSIALTMLLITACQPDNSQPQQKAASQVEVVIEEKTEPSVSQLEQDLDFFSGLFEGEYTNFYKAYKSDALSTVRHYVYRKVDLPAFGDHVVYVQQYGGSGEKAESVFRQRLYQSYVDPERNEIVTKIYSFPQDQQLAVRDAQFDPSKLQGITPEMMSTLPDGCEVFWSRDGDNIVGYQKEGVCVMNIPGTETKMLLIDDLLLNAESFTTKTFAKDLKGNKIFGEDSPSTKHLASIYHCGISGEGYQTQTVRIHDLGGEFTFENQGNKLRLRREKSDLSSQLTLELLKGLDVLAAASATSIEASFTLDPLTVDCSIADDPWQRL